MNARILIVDDHEVVRGGIKALLADFRPQWEICGEASDGAQAIRDAHDLKPDIILLDISMPGMSGFEASVRMKASGIKCPILIFTMHQSERLEIDVRQANAQGFVLKSQAFRDLILAIEILLGGGTFFGAPPQDDNALDKHLEKKSGIDFRIIVQPGFA